MKLTKKGNVKVTLTFHPTWISLPEEDRCVLGLMNSNAALVEGFYRIIDGRHVLVSESNIPDIDMNHLSHWAYTGDITSGSLDDATR